MTKDRARIKSEQYIKWAILNENKAKDLQTNWYRDYGQFDWTEPIKRGHHSQRRHEKVFEKRASFHTKMKELEDKAKRMREKSENLLIFANTNKGDAEAKRQIQRDLADSQIVVGSKVYDWCFGDGVVEKVNKKTYTIQFKSGSKFTRDKSYIKI